MHDSRDFKPAHICGHDCQTLIIKANIINGSLFNNVKLTFCTRWGPPSPTMPPPPLSSAVKKNPLPFPVDKLQPKYNAFQFKFEKKLKSFPFFCQFSQC